MKKLVTKLDKKIKIVIGVLIGVFVIIPNFIIFVEVTKTQDSEYGYTKFTNRNLLNLYIKMPKISPFEDLAGYISGKASYSSDQNGYVYMDRDEANDNRKVRNRYTTIDNAIKCHEMGSESLLKGKYYFKNSFSLANLYYLNNEKDKAFAVLEKMKSSKNEEVINYAHFNEGIFNLKSKEYDKAIAIFEKIDEKIFPQKNHYLADAYKLKGDTVKANEFYARDLEFNLFDKKSNIIPKYYLSEDINYVYNKNYDLKIQPSKYEELKEEEEFIDEDVKILEKFKTNIISDEFRGSVKGQFKFNDVNMDGAIITIGKFSGLENETKGPIKLFMAESYAYVDDNGGFEFNNIVEGRYRIGLLVPRNKISEGSMLLRFYERDITVKRGETIEVALNEQTLKEDIYGYKNAEKYKASVIDNKVGLIKDEKGDIEIINDYFEEFNIVLKDEINLYTMFDLGDFSSSLNNEYYIRTKTEDKNEESDDERNPYIEDYRVKHMNFVIDYGDEVETYMGNNQYDKVLEYYENEYKKDNKNEFTLQMLIKLYTTGTGNKGENKDVNKAIKFADELYEINRDENLNTQVRTFIKDNYLKLYS